MDEASIIEEKSIEEMVNTNIEKLLTTPSQKILDEIDENMFNEQIQENYFTDNMSIK